MMTTIELFPADIYNQKTIQQGHPGSWTNRAGGEYDLVVLGGGPAGLVATMTAAAGGHRVAMTEQRLTGGTCVNFGCTPSKALSRCARAIYDAGRGAEFGFRLDGPPRAEFGAVMERVRRMRSTSSAGDAVEVVEQTGAEVYLGHTRFTAPNIVDVDGRELRFRKAVIAAGSDPFVPPIDGLKTGEYLTNESVFSLTELPARLAVIGGGPLACELAQAFHRLGCEVGLVSHTEDLMSRDEAEAGELIRRQHARPTTFRCTTWGAILPPRHPPRLVRAPSIRGRRRTSWAFGLCRSEARDRGIARQPGLGSKPDRRVHRAVPMVAAPLDNLEEKASLLGPRIDLEELAAAIAIVENISCAQPVNLRRVKIGPRLQIVVVVLGDRQELDGVGPQLLDGAEDVLGRECDLLHSRAEEIVKKARRHRVPALRGVENEADGAPLGLDRLALDDAARVDDILDGRLPEVE